MTWGRGLGMATYLFVFLDFSKWSRFYIASNTPPNPSPRPAFFHTHSSPTTFSPPPPFPTLTPAYPAPPPPPPTRPPHSTHFNFPCYFRIELPTSRIVMRLISRGAGSVEGFHGNWDQVFIWEMGGEGDPVRGWILRILAGFLDSGDEAKAVG